MSTSSSRARPSYYDEGVDMFADAVRLFAERECLPDIESWAEHGHVPRATWRKAGEAGLLMASMPEEYGGAGANFAYEAAIMEVFGQLGVHQFMISVQNAVFAPYVETLASEEQKRNWIPKLASGEWIGAIAMSEPNAGSDLQAIKTTARKDGDTYVINGQKIFTTHGHVADIIMLACKTDTQQGSSGISLFMVETASPGFERGRKLDKIGYEAGATAELFFNEVRIPESHLLGGVEGQGFKQMMINLPQERLVVAIESLAMLERAIDLTVQYTKERSAFKRTIMEFQNTQFVLADCKAKAVAARAFVDKCVEQHLRGELDDVTAAMAKYWLSELQGEVIDKCLQLFGGYGYINEYPIAQMYRDARVSRIYGGTNEIMRLIIGRSL